MTDIPKISRPDCIICKQPGNILYKDLKDKLFAAPDTWEMSGCPTCKGCWLNPYPEPTHIPLLYKKYYTHNKLNNEFLSQNIPFNKFPLNKKLKYAVLKNYFGYKIHVSPLFNAIGIIAGIFPNIRKKAFVGTGGFVSPDKTKTILDVGCGNGDFVMEMNFLGWNARGIEIDPESVKIARSNNLDVNEGNLESKQYAPDSFDGIYMNNVIEHVPDAVRTIQECYRVLKPGGRISLYTCSSTSLAHHIYKSDYRGLEIPRHIFVFSPLTLRKLLEQNGFRVKKVKTYFNQYIWAASRAISKNDPDAAYASLPKIKRILLKTLSSIILTLFPQKGDDIFILGEKIDAKDEK